MRLGACTLAILSTRGSAGHRVALLDEGADDDVIIVAFAPTQIELVIGC